MRGVGIVYSGLELFRFLTIYRMVQQPCQSGDCLGILHRLKTMGYTKPDEPGPARVGIQGKCPGKMSQLTI